MPVMELVNSRASDRRVAARRQPSGRSGWELDPLTSAPLTRHQARAVEQAIIAGNTGMKNKINSISPKRDIYQGAVDWGNEWLKNNG